MISKNIVNQPKSIVEVTVTAPWEDLAPVYDQTLNRMAQDVEIAGFRKGQAPLNMVEGQLGQRLADEVLKTAMPNLLIQALQGSAIVPIDYPKYDLLVPFVKGQQVQFKATVTNRPEVKVGDYKVIKTSRPEKKVVTADEVKKVIDDLFNRWQVRQPAGTQPLGGSQPTDITTPSTGGGSINFNGSNPVQAPTVTPSTPTLPNDEFARAMGANNLMDLNNKVKKDLEDNANYNNELDYEEAILQEVEKITSVELPEVLIQDELNRMLVSLQRRVADMGLLLEDYLKNQGKSLEQIKTEWRPQAEKNVRMELGLAEIARHENVSITDEELQAEIDKIQDAKVKAQFASQEPRLHLRHALMQTSTLDLLKKMVG